LVEIGGGESDVPALPAAADIDAAEIPGSDVTVERFDGAVELGSGLRGGLEPVRWRLARLTRLTQGNIGAQIRTVLARDGF
jgi:hypothetical protein